MGRKHIAAETVAEEYLSLLKERGVERLFVNGGTDFASIVEAYAHAKDAGLDLPTPIVCSHENLAVSMAHGAYLVDGRPQAVMLHVSVGTANGICGIFNASRDRIPILLTAGRTPLFEHTEFGHRNGYIHWAQEMFDQAGMVRELVKWDYELRDGVQVEAIVDRAVAIAMTEPRGPIYLSLPREVLARPVHDVTIDDVGTAVPSEPHPDPSIIDEVAHRIANAQLPVIVTSSSGIDRRTVPLLEELSERYAVGVLENKPRFMNFSSEHPNHLGYQINPILEAADVLICLDIDVPWFQGLASPREDATVVQCGTDPLFSRYPVRSHRSDISVMATPRSILAALLDALEGRSEGIDPSRSERIAAMGASRRARSSAAVEAESKAAGPITKPFMNWALAQVRTPETIHVNEYWALPEVLRPTLPGTYFDTPPSGGLGWGLPCALGVQIASPGKTVIASLGDGAYLFANPASCHHAMAMHDLPVLTVLANNSKWGAVEGAARGMYPEGYASAAGELTPIARLDPAAHYEQYSIASGGHGEVVTERSALVPALRRALNVVQREHRQALLNVICQ